MALGCVNPEGKSLISSAWSENLECCVQWGQLWSQAEFWGLCFSTWWQEISQNRWVQREKMSLFCSCITCLCQFKWPPGLGKIFWTLRAWKGIRNYFLPSLRFPHPALLVRICCRFIAEMCCSLLCPAGLRNLQTQKKCVWKKWHLWENQSLEGQGHPWAAGVPPQLGPHLVSEGLCLSPRECNNSDFTWTWAISALWFGVWAHCFGIFYFTF